MRFGFEGFIEMAGGDLIPRGLSFHALDVVLGTGLDLHPGGF